MIDFSQLSVRLYEDNGHLSTSLAVTFGGHGEPTVSTSALYLVDIGAWQWNIVHTQVLRKFTSSPPWVRFHQLSQSVVVDIGFASSP
ncbi:unnamed protein product [Heligmosomoides polygyrus]|uniref:Laminin G domain-containing protein n=1 Tax=Heligmosomoides polygyrus TaxID=6339 RepID=A0A183GE08_HELPZ|nr:unnamed protein product [Heligmosomoides polygyrus]